MSVLWFPIDSPLKTTRQSLSHFKEVWIEFLLLMLTSTNNLGLRTLSIYHVYDNIDFSSLLEQSMHIRTLVLMPGVQHLCFFTFDLIIEFLTFDLIIEFLIMTYKF